MAEALFVIDKLVNNSYLLYNFLLR